MKSYLSLIPISAKAHRRQNRMTQLCIVFAVFMVTAVFSMAEMVSRMEQSRLLEKHDNLYMGDLFESSMGQTVLLTAGVLFLLILTAGVLMISGSMNSIVAQRIQFFGMMRCLGMSKQQIVRYVRLEALNWCKMAVPLGIGLGIVTTWGLCGILRFLVGEEFSQIPLFGISGVGIVCGILVGVITVLLGANAPAKRASRVSPVSAVSGNAGSEKKIRHGTSMLVGKIETRLGVNHAVSARKNMILMTGSFALSIILLFGFLAVIDCVDYVMPQSVATSDIDIASDGENTIPCELLAVIREMDGVKEIYGRRSVLELPASLNAVTGLSDTVDLISYDDFELRSLKKDGNLKKGSDLSRVYGDSNYVLATSDADSPWKIGDTIQLGGETLTIAGLLKNDPFSEDGMTHGKMTIIVSNDTFVRLTGEDKYALVMIQATANVTEEEVQAIQTAVGQDFSFRDKRDERTTGTYRAFVFCGYAFLAIIALITVLNIVNSISMSVSARIKQYGAMRAVGMDDRQITKMIAAEAVTYAVSGTSVGVILGLLLHHFIYANIIVSRFHGTWNLPFAAIGVIVLLVTASCFVAVYAPAKRIRNMPITATINEL